MSDEETPDLTELLDSIRLFLAQPLDFSSTDPDTTEAKVRIFTVAAYYFNILAIAEFGGRPGAPRTWFG